MLGLQTRHCFRIVGGDKKEKDAIINEINQLELIRNAGVPLQPGVKPLGIENGKWLPKSLWMPGDIFLNASKLCVNSYIIHYQVAFDNTSFNPYSESVYYQGKIFDAMTPRFRKEIELETIKSHMTEEELLHTKPTIKLILIIPSKTIRA